MKQYVGEKSVAWFKLAECIGRGEKERALGLYRLLTYSFDDQAFVKKLEAEIIATFDKELAAKEFLHAAHLYFTRGDIKETIFIYELLHDLFPEKTEYLERLIDLTQAQSQHDRVLMYQKKICTLLLQEGKCQQAAALLPTLKEQLDGAAYAQLTHLFVCKALEFKVMHQQIMTHYLHETLATYVRFDLDRELQQFMASLQLLNRVWHQDAVAYLSDKK